MSFSSTVISRVEQHALAEHPFVLITNNCWGSDIYPTLSRSYNTPFVGLYLPGPSYINLLKDLNGRLREKLTFIDRSPLRDQSYPFPIALLGEDVEVHFMHYVSAQEAEQKWTRRLHRMSEAIQQGAPLRFKFCDRDPENDACLKQFHELKLEGAVSFGVSSLEYPNHVCVPPDLASMTVPVGPRLYRKRYQYFDFCDWIKTGQVRHTVRSRLLSLFR